MKRLFILISVLIYFPLLSFSQVIKVSPYLQDASPHSIFILWETDSMEESIVEWGLTESLGNTTLGTAETSLGEAKIHEVQLENLQRFTTYFYRVKTGNAVSEIFSFKTPPFASDNEPFRIIAMSDMQRDSSQPDKFQEIVEEGVISFLENQTGSELRDKLAFVLIPGDLVVNGNNYGSWESTFFDPSRNLFNQVPVYPVPGNHENDAIYFFKYFKLPENGTIGFEEHSWYKDYGNVRIIGLDSNNPYNSQQQLDWLENTLTSTCEADSIDFVFAQLHHPHKSELWTPGESTYTGEVINLLENFSTDCEKPSIHFFGHTHGYSRGQSRDHKHLWINVASAGGAIDNWGEFPNFDYDEFSVSQDEYGFVSIEVSSEPDPKITIKRISRGDQDITLDNQISDSLTIYLNPFLVSTPVPEFPIDVEIAPECVVLEANDFSSNTPGNEHGQSHWQVSESEVDFTDLVAEHWKNFENWYFEEDTQAGDDLRDEAIMGLSENTTYWWRVRYRDKALNWSDWSSPVSFNTGPSLALPNLLKNPGAEEDLESWTIIEGIAEVLTDGICNGISPNSGDKYFSVGGICEHSEVGRMIQEIDVVDYTDSIESGNFLVNFGGYLSNFGGTDLPEMRLIFLDQNGLELSSSIILSTLNPSWTLLSESMLVPVQTKRIQVELKGTRLGGTDNDSYFDDLFLTLGTNDFTCLPVTSDHSMFSTERLTFDVIPNPFKDEGFIQLPNQNYDDLQLNMLDSHGAKVNCEVKYESDRIIIKRGSLPGGVYFFLVRNKKDVIGTGKIVIL